MLLELVDGGIERIESDSDFTSGCSTCDYGSNYTNEYTITMTTGTIYIEASQEYDYALSDGYMMEIILPNVDTIMSMTEKEFFDWIEDKIKSSNISYAIDKIEFREK